MRTVLLKFSMFLMSMFTLIAWFSCTLCSCPDVFVFNPKLSSPMFIILNPVTPQDVGLLYQNILQGVLSLREALRGNYLNQNSAST